MPKTIAFWISWLPLPVSAAVLVAAVNSGVSLLVALAIGALAGLVAVMGSRPARSALVWRRSSLVAASVGLVVGVFVMWACWVDNPQGEFHDGPVIHWAYWCSEGLSWF